MQTFIRICVVALFMVLSGCATYSDKFKPVEKQLVKGNYPEALEKLEEVKGPDRDRVLYLMNKGIILRLNGQFEDSNAALEEAKKIAEPLQAISVSEQAGAVSVNDAMRSYAGEDFELVFLHAFMAMNYLDMNDPDSARVEALQIDERMDEIKDNDFHEDGFARYLMGLIFESLGERDDALISYRHAYESYTDLQDKYHVAVPVSLKKDLLRLTKQLGFDDEHEKYKEKFGNIDWDPKKDLTRKKGEFVVIFNNNLAPKKKEKSIQSVANGKLVRIALPYYVSRPTVATHVVVDDGEKRVKSEMVENVDAIAIDTLKDQIAGITARAVARAIVKNRTADKVGDKNPIVGLILNIFGFASERADTRSWLTLPDNIQLARMVLAPGKYNFDIEIHDGTQVLDTRHVENVRIRAGEKTFHSLRWIAH